MKIRCKKCGEIIEGDKKGTYITCKCKAIAIDETEYYWRINGNIEDFEEVKEDELVDINAKEILIEKIEKLTSEESGDK